MCGERANDVHDWGDLLIHRPSEIPAGVIKANESMEVVEMVVQTCITSAIAICVFL
jgi:hypothetical protein